MTATNHICAGALIAIALRQPLLVVPGAFASHFVLDAIPHFGVEHADMAERNANPLFRRVLQLDVVGSVLSLIVLPTIFSKLLPWYVVLAGSLAALSPDTVWMYRTYIHHKHKIDPPRNRLTRFHKWIQTSETPWGLVTEIAWLVFATAMFSLLKP